MTEIHMVKQIDNSRLVKEVDFQKTRECLVLMILAMACLLVLLFLAWQQFEVVRQGYEREELRKEIKHLTEINRQLKLERATLRSPAANRSDRQKDSSDSSVPRSTRLWIESAPEASRNRPRFFWQPGKAAEWMLRWPDSERSRKPTQRTADSRWRNRWRIGIQP